MSVTNPSSKARPLLGPRIAKELRSWPRFLRRQLRARLEVGPGAQRLAAADTEALYLVLLARTPESAAIYDRNRGRRASALMADMMRSPEFADRILPALLAQGALPHERLGWDALGRVRAWLERSGIGRAGASGGWSEALAVLFTEQPGARLLIQVLPQQAPALAAAFAEIRRAHAAVQAPAAETDVTAIYQLLLGRPLAGAADFAAHRSRSREDVVAALLAGAEFRERVVLPLLLDLPLPQQQLPTADLPVARAWMTGIGLTPARAGAGWLDLFADLLLSQPVGRLMRPILPAYADRLQQQAKAIKLRGSGEVPLVDADIDALYLLLLGRRPEGEVVYRDRRGRPRGRLIAEILGSNEFRERMLHRLLDEAPPATPPIGSAELAIGRAWVAETGVVLAPDATDWLGVVAAFLGAEPARSLVPAALPDLADRLQRRMAQEALRSAEERQASVRAGEQARRLRTDLDAIDGRLKELEAGWRQHVPAFLNAVSSVGAFAHRQAQVQRELDSLRADLDRAGKKAAE